MSDKPGPSSQQFWRKQVIQWIGIPLAGGIVISLGHDFADLQAGDYAGFLESVVISTVFWSVLANGNGLIIPFLDKRWTWLEHPIKRIVVGVGALLVFTILASFVIIYLYVEVYFGADLQAIIEARGAMFVLGMPLGITIVVAMWQHGYGFLIAWRQTAINVEKLKNENLRSKFESLRNQVNPHFLFNSLNALSTLVYSDQNKAEHFIHKLTDVYRYVLDHQNDDIVELSSEVAFLKSFVYLNQIRFGDNLIVNYHDLEGFQKSWALPPVALQILVENCIKHNEVSKDHPLTIDVRLHEMEISIENNINPITTQKHSSSGLGLANVKLRYELLTDKKVEIEKTDSIFLVKIPVLILEE